MNLRTFAALSTLALAACGGGDNLNPGDACKLTFSGARSFTTACTAIGAHNDSDGLTGFAISANDTVNGAFNFALELGTSDLAAKTYTKANVNTAGATYSSKDYTQSWAALYKEAGSADQGAFSLSITSAGTKITASGGAGWPNPKGSADLTLTPLEVGTTGTITVHLTF